MIATLVCMVPSSGPNNLQIKDLGQSYCAQSFNDYAMLHCSRNVSIMLMKLSNYAHEIVELCSKMCLADTGLIFAVHVNGRSDCG